MKLAISEEQQREMRHAHYDGAPGVLVSALVWMAAALVCHRLGLKPAVGTLLIGGALIYPASALLTKALGRPARTGKDNALNQLGAASTIWLILCCAMAYGLYLSSPGVFFPAMMAVIGSRYLVFASMYGSPVYWLMGASLIVAGIGAGFAALAPAIAAGVGALLELVFAVFMLSRAWRPVVRQ
ncbi:DUF7010 family protein [Massilia sp. DWR3-1-1]|uniref:DUF7010 family protein n=1 Tax=Massilia sp. DWR3-1-1 TaxID=2804559 RepID=UPI003CF28F11